MKKVILLAFMLLPLVASADQVEVDGLKYTINTETMEATVAKNNYSGILSIPGTILVEGVEYTVTAIADYAFNNKGDLISVTFPKSMKKIGTYAFADSPYLISVKFGDGLEEIGARAFSYCSSLQSITFGNSVKSIGTEAFYGCSSLNQIYISDLKRWCMIDFTSSAANPLYYAHHLYLNKKELKQLFIPEGIENIKKYAFYGGSNITTLDVPSGVSEIGDCAFSGCSSLASVNFPESLTKIGLMSFYNCNSLEEIELSDDITTIDESAFYGCSKLQKLKLPQNLQIIKSSAFCGCSSLRSVTIPSTVEFIFQYAFSFSASETVEFFMKEEYPPLAYENSFPSGAKFYVPDGSIEPYQNVVPWKDYELHTFSSSGPEKCATPVIIYKNGTLSFTSETPDAEFHYLITSADAQKNTSSSLNVSGKLLVRVYASKSGYEDSETVESAIDVRGIEGDVNGDGVVNVADHVKLSDIIMNNE